MENTDVRENIDVLIHIINGCHTNNVNPTFSPAEKMNGERIRMITQARVVIDACRDISWKEDWYPMAKMKPEMRENILDKWRSVLSKYI